MKKFLYLIVNVALFISIFSLGFFFSLSSKYPYALGLDLQGGIRILYNADVSDIEATERGNQMSALREVVEKRIDALGVAEPSVYTETSILSGSERVYRLAVELPGLKDIDEAVEQIGKTPLLEFRIYDQDLDGFSDTGITGALVSKSDVVFVTTPTGGITNTPAVNIDFNKEGSSLFAALTKENVGKTLGIFLDGSLISNPVIREPILGGVTQITGGFSIAEAQTLSRDLNFGALPVPIAIEETHTVSPTLGNDTVNLGIKAGALALILVILLLVIVYRFVGLISGVALVSYLIIMLGIFKALPVVLSAAGIAGFVMSLGLAVDANVLIFERMREELQSGKSFPESVSMGFSRAWNSIRDANISSLLIAFLLFWFGTSLVKGFAFTFGIGVLVSFFSAILISRALLWTLALVIRGKAGWWLISK